MLNRAISITRDGTCGCLALAEEFHHPSVANEFCTAPCAHSNYSCGGPFAISVSCAQDADTTECDKIRNLQIPYSQPFPSIDSTKNAELAKYPISCILCLPGSTCDFRTNEAPLATHFPLIDSPESCISFCQNSFNYVTSNNRLETRGPTNYAILGWTDQYMRRRIREHKRICSCVDSLTQVERIDEIFCADECTDGNSCVGMYHHSSVVYCALKNGDCEIAEGSVGDDMDGDCLLKCQKTDTKSIAWKVCAGKVGAIPCKEGFSGYIRWSCSFDGAFETEQPVYSGCKSKWLEEVIEDVKLVEDDDWSVVSLPIFGIFC